VTKGGFRKRRQPTDTENMSITDTEREQLRNQLQTKPPSTDASERLTVSIPVTLWQQCALFKDVMGTDMSFVVSESLRRFFASETAFTTFVQSNPDKLPPVPKRGKKTKSKNGSK
jgi:hypothetical protein